jgi:hypothetical protein
LGNLFCKKGFPILNAMKAHWYYKKSLPDFTSVKM